MAICFFFFSKNMFSQIYHDYNTGACKVNYSIPHGIVTSAPPLKNQNIGNLEAVDIDFFFFFEN